MQGDMIEGNVGGPETADEARNLEAHSRAVVLEMIGDLPEAEAKPPSNMLFVCKLNPVTGEEVLHRLVEPDCIGLIVTVRYGSTQICCHEGGKAEEIYSGLKHLFQSA